MLKKLVFTLLLGLMAWQVNAAPVNINTADAQTIADSLKGVGLAKAKAIVLYREQHGAFKQLADLTQVSGIGDKTLEMNADNILLQDVKP
ncbi:MAG: helix-hairpin-helix domain-containing protein [Thiomicrospira sp.]|jgi:competence protein ComEA